MRAEHTTPDKEGKTNFQGWVDSKIASDFDQSIEHLAPTVKKGPAVERLLAWWNSLLPQQQRAFYGGQDPIVPITTIIHPLYADLYATYKEDMISAAVLAFSRLPADEREKHVREATGSLPLRKRDTVFGDMNLARAKEIHADQASEAAIDQLVRTSVRVAASRRTENESVEESKNEQPASSR